VHVEHRGRALAVTNRWLNGPGLNLVSVRIESRETTPIADIWTTAISHDHTLGVTRND
jgi:hypothetical protein